MALVVEDGSIVAGANSYVSVAYARSYAETRDLTLCSNNKTLEGQLILAMDYLESLRSKYQGSKVDATTQNLQWPRSDVQIDGEDFSETSIPTELQKAQVQLAVEQEAGVNLFPTETGKFSIREKVGALETEYSEKIVNSVMPNLTKVDALLNPLLSSRYRNSALSSLRI